MSFSYKSIKGGEIAILSVNALVDSAQKKEEYFDGQEEVNYLFIVLGRPGWVMSKAAPTKTTKNNEKIINFFLSIKIILLC